MRNLISGKLQVQLLLPCIPDKKILLYWHVFYKKTRLKHFLIKIGQNNKANMPSQGVFSSFSELEIVICNRLKIYAIKKGKKVKTEKNGKSENKPVEYIG
ncbi:MAG: hypothetical protein BWK80_18370 [Desulfobacteraceae bacterium IS3]|nr:MAG: hypothetical protein BWK80_18370 [Desulfobacteraceae bacterium IS3]HAO19974.1 hypothetical protein [Desulfobacteraceae bacterium]